jgi:Ni2+-binding GTPase involved in maturation of urease and hydrogenase
MRLVNVAGPPSSGKTSVIIHAINCLRETGVKAGVVKFDCLTSFDQKRYDEYSIPNHVGFSGKICPDHFFMSNIEDSVSWGKNCGFDLLVTESAGLCNRCSPYIRNILSICVIDNLSGVNTPKKIGPMLKFADIIVITKGDIVSQAEREVFAFNVKQVNTEGKVIFVNGITGQGAFMLSKYIAKTKDIFTVKDMHMRFTTPSAVCAYCTGETRIGENHHLGTMRKINFGDAI